MTLVDARARAAGAVKKATRGDVTVTRFDGVMDAAEIRRQQLKPPAVHVSVMGRDADRNVLLVAYVIHRMRTGADDSGLRLVDTVEEVMRTLLGKGRPLLEIRTQTLYDPRAEKAGGVAMWAVSTALPPLIGDAPEGADVGLLHALDALLARVLGAGGLGWRWASTEPQRDRLLLDGELPFALATYGADSAVEAEVGVYRYEVEGTTYERDRLGNRAVSAQVDLLGRTEEEVEQALDSLLAGVPRNWVYEGLALAVDVRRVVGSHWRRKEGAHATVAEVRLQVPVPQGPPRVVETRRMQGRSQCGEGFQPAPAAPPEVDTNGDGIGARVQSIDVDREGRITGVAWVDSARGSGYAAGDRLVFVQGAILGRWTLREADVAAGALQDLAISQAPIAWVEDGRLRRDVQEES